MCDWMRQMLLQPMLALCWLTASSFPLAAQLPLTVEGILSTEQATRPKIKSAHITWTEEAFCPKGHYHSERQVEQDKTTERGKATFPDKDIKFTVKASLKLKNDSVRYERDGLAPNPSRGCLSPTKYLIVYGGGERCQQFYEHDVPDTADGKLRSGADLNKSAVYVYHDESLCPIKWALRIDDGRNDPNGKDWDLLEGAFVREGVEFARLAKKGISSPFKYVFNFDLSRNNSLTRMSWFHSDGLVAETEIEYEKHSLPTWFPKTWHYVHYRKKLSTGQLVLDQEVFARIDSVLVNVEFPTSEFEFKFPPRTYISVINPSTGGESKAVVTDRNSEKVPVSSLPRSSNWENIVESGFEPKSWYSRVNWTGIAVGLLIVSLLLCWLRRSGSSKSLK